MAHPRADVKFTYDDYRALPETGPRYQLVEGELLMTPAPNWRHSTIVSRIFVALYSFVEKRKLGQVRIAPVDVLLSEVDVLQPDILYVSNARRSYIASEGVRGAPDLCVEVLSEGSRSMDLGPKKKLYARHGVREYWVADPGGNTLEVFRFAEGAESPVARLGPTDTLLTPLLPGFSLALAGVFAE